MYVNYIIPSFNLGTITNSDIRWLACPDWELEHSQYFAQGRAGHPEQALKLPSYYDIKKRRAPFVGGAWVLEPNKPGSKPLAWVEVHCFFRLIESYFVIVSELDDGESWDGPMQSALSLLISGIFLSTECQRIQVYGLGKSADHLQNLKWGEPHKAIQFRQDQDLAQTGKIWQDCPLISISEHTWWNLENAVVDKKSLNYLARRIESRQKRGHRKMTAASRKRRNVFRILARRLIGKDSY